MTTTSYPAPRPLDPIDPTLTEEDASPTTWVRLHGDYLHRYALGRVRDPQVAEDLVQDTFLAALKARDRFAGQSSERTWLTGILRHKILDHLRQRYRRPIVALDDSESARDDDRFGESPVWTREVAADEPPPHRRMELTELRESLTRALARLPARLARVFELYEVDERTGREVCEAENITEQNLWVMLHRARKQLRQEMVF
ncbi:MAG: sigma-70 family RNA polymerase sigma factor [Limisphaerales bacterium]